MVTVLDPYGKDLLTTLKLYFLEMENRWPKHKGRAVTAALRVF
jgi:hypothetical protein